ncbi:MAG: lytic murein transglycosylase [Bdellovibrionota bacterium]
MTRNKFFLISSSVAVSLALLFNSSGEASGPAIKLPPAKCQKDFNSFEAWREDFRVEAMRSGVSTVTWNAALPSLVVDTEVLSRDNSQGAFYTSFLKFSIPRAHPRIPRARNLLKSHGALFKKVEATYGIPGEILLSLWGLETDFAVSTIPGATQFPILSSMTTLAYDCRRPEIFRDNLKSALKLIENKTVDIENMTGQWAGEMSGLQLTPSNYLNFGVDFDKDGRIDIVNSVPDLMASAASMLKSYGWVAKQPYIIEVKVPEKMDWQYADLTLEKMHPLANWTKQGVTLADGSALPAGLPNASLMLPMGHLGPAFLAFPNFKTLLQWNASLNNALTASYLAYRTANVNAPPMSSGNGTPEILTAAMLKNLQTLLAKRGYNMGKIDGFLGTATRAATKDMQMKLGLPADGYPTTELLNKL